MKNDKSVNNISLKHGKIKKMRHRIGKIITRPFSEKNPSKTKKW